MKRLMIVLQPSVASRRLVLHLHCITSTKLHVYIEILRFVVQNQADNVLQSSLNPSLTLPSDNQSQAFIRFHVEMNRGDSSSYQSATPQIAIASVDILPPRAELNAFKTCEAWQRSVIPMNISVVSDQHVVACTVLKVTHNSQVNPIQLIESDQWENEEFWIGLRSKLRQQMPEGPDENLCRDHLRLELDQTMADTNTLVFEMNVTRFVPFSFLSLVHPVSSLFSPQDLSYLSISEIIHWLQNDELVIMLPIHETMQCNVVIENSQSVDEIDVESIPLQVTTKHSAYAADIGLVFNMSLLKRVWNETQEELNYKRQLSEETQKAEELLDEIMLLVCVNRAVYK